MKSLDRHVPSPLEYFAALVADDHDFALFEAAASIAQDDFPQLDLQAVMAEIDALGERLGRRLPADASAMQRLRMLNHYFFVELGFGGNLNDYYDRRNSYVHEVLACRRGIPITLALLYMELGERIGLSVHGVSFPGHYLVRLRLGRGEVVIDPLDGRSLSREDLEERLWPYRQHLGLPDTAAVPLGLFLQSAPPRQTVARMLRNLKEVHRSARDWPRLLAVQRRLVVLLPQVADELRDRGLAQAELGYCDEAARDLEDYLARCPQADDAAAIAERARELRQFGSSRAH